MPGRSEVDLAKPKFPSLFTASSRSRKKADPVNEAMSILTGQDINFSDDISDHPFKDVMHLFGEFLKQRNLLRREGK